MNTVTISSRAFNQDVSKAKRDVLGAPVFIADRGQPAHVLLSMAAYQKIVDKEQGIVELLAMPDAADVHFEPVPLKQPVYRPADLS